MTKPLPRNCQIPVAGVSYRQDAVHTVAEDDAVRLIADPSNPHDASAIAVVTADGRLLGYVPATLTPRLHATGAAAFDAVVTEVLRRETWGLRLAYRGVADDQDIVPPGHVARTDGPPDGDEADDGDVAADDGPATTVRTRSGRVLGTFAGTDGRFTLVTVDGRQVRYPSAVVEVAPAA